MGFKCPNCLDDKTQKLSIFYENNTNPKTMETNSLLAEKFLPPNLEIWRPTFVFFITFITVNIISDYSLRRILGIDNLKTFAGKTEGVTSLFLSVFIAIIVSSLVKKRNKKKEELYKEKLFFWHISYICHSCGETFVLSKCSVENSKNKKIPAIDI